MAKKDESVADVAPEELTLDEFCIRLSVVDRRPELLSGFHFTETRAGHLKDVESAYRDRFAVYVNTPV
jgi:hypothetical protein